jgi:hypothetical protein
LHQAYRAAESDYLAAWQEYEHYATARGLEQSTPVPMTNAEVDELRRLCELVAAKATEWEQELKLWLLQCAGLRSTSPE